MKSFKPLLMVGILISCLFLQGCFGGKGDGGKNESFAIGKIIKKIEKKDQIGPAGEKLTDNRIVSAQIDTGVIDGHRVARYNKKYNAVDGDNYLVYPKWYDGIQLITGNMAIVTSGTEHYGNIENLAKQNVIDESGIAIFKDRKKQIQYIGEGYFLIDSKNIADNKGIMILKDGIGHTFASNVSEGIFGIQNINRETISEGFLGLDKRDVTTITFNYMNLEGKVLCKDWLNGISDFNSGYAIVTRGDKQNIIDKNCNELFDWKYSSIVKFNKMFFAVDGEGFKRISDDFKTVSDFSYGTMYQRKDGFISVSKELKENLMTDKGDFLFDTGYDKIGELKGGVFMLTDNDKLNIADEKGKVLSSERFDKMDMSSKGYYIVQNGDKRNAMETGGKLLSDWVSSYYELAKNGYSQ